MVHKPETRVHIQRGRETYLQSVRQGGEHSGAVRGDAGPAELCPGQRGRSALHQVLRSTVRVPVPPSPHHGGSSSPERE